MQTNTLPELNRLGDLARKIRDTHEAATILAEQTRNKSREAITEALLCGQALNEAKELVPHGQWMNWLGEHCPAISQQTANRYMAISKCSHVSNLDDSTSLRQLYLATGIISEPRKEPCQKPASPSESSSTASDSENTSQTPSENYESSAESLSESSAQKNGQTSSSDESRQTFPGDRFGHLRSLVESLLLEIDKLCDVSKADVAAEISPIIQWAQCMGIA